MNYFKRSGPDFHIPDLNACSQNSQEGYKAILEKRRKEEARKNPNAKCKVVVKSTVTVGEAKASSMASSKALMEKVLAVFINLIKSFASLFCFLR